MKRISTILLLLIGMAFTAHSQLNVSGLVMEDNPSGMPIPNQDILIDVYVNGGLLVSSVAVTNQQGFYEENLVVNTDQGQVVLSTTDCNNAIISYTHDFIVGDSSYIYQNFSICADSIPGCMAMFDYEILSPLSVQFMNMSQGGNLEYLWDFGDGQTSTEENPIHEYAQFGGYPVLLTVVDNSIGCTSSAPGYIVLDSMTGSCQAMFQYFTAPNQPLTLNFMDQSMGNPTNFNWDFGDGQGSNLQYPVHTYDQPGYYQICLSISSNDSTCFDMYCITTLVGNDTLGCQADYAYFPSVDSANPNGNYRTLQFVDMSFGNPTSWMWNFGDGSASSEQNPVHTFGTDGVYQVCLTIQSADSTCFSEYCQEIVVQNDTTSCMAQFTYFADSSQNQHVIQFVDLSEGNIDSWFWDFGDGNSSVVQNPVHAYNAPGFYNVCLTVQGMNNCISTTCQNVIVQEDTTSCIAQYAYYPDSSQSPYSLQFVDLSYGNIADWYWDFGDGTSSVVQNPMHTFPDAGMYYVCLTITGPISQSVWCEEVYVEAGSGCYNYFTYQTVGNTVQFSGFHSSDAPASYTWDFGDGMSGEGQQATHDYAGPGMYYVSLQSWDDNMCEAVSSQMVVVGDTIAYNQIYGQVFAGNFPITEGNVMIFSLDTTGNYQPYTDITTIDSTGVYVFSYVPNGEFVIFALGMNYNEYLPTYYGDVINWEEATTVVLGDPNNPYDIHLVETAAPMMSGMGDIIGQVNQGRVSASFIEDINMLIYNEDSESIGYTTVNESGDFDFSDLAMGIYYLYPELPGVQAQMMRVELTDMLPQAEVNMTFANGSILGIDDKVTLVEAGNIYPNPVRDLLHVQLNVLKSTQVSISVIGLDGRMYMNLQQQVNVGSDDIQMEVSELPKGMYILQISGDNQTSLHRKFIK